MRERHTRPASTVRLDSDLFVLNDAAAMQVERKQIAGRPVIVVDGVYKHPERVRHFALGLEFDLQAGMYPGRLASLAGSQDDLLGLVNGLLCDGAGRSLVTHPDYRGRLIFALLS